ncbi:MAG: hypothetical protein E7558_08710 [Ruminococcaceae bacterium]|nr:hypothetical protein [Oscillospiraceae bacterium]
MKRPRRIRCDCCGEYLDLKNDIDCTQMQMFSAKDICQTIPNKPDDFVPVEDGMLYYCGDCKSTLLCKFVRAYRNKTKAGSADVHQ